MKKTILSLGLAALAFSSLACTPPKEDKKLTQVPSDMQLNLRPEMTKIHPLSLATKGEFALVMKSARSFIPSTGLILGTSSSDLAQMQKDQLNTDGKNFYNSIKANCEIDAGKQSIKGEAGEGNTQTITRNGSANGINCPISLIHRESTSVKFDAVDQSAHKASVSFTGDMVDSLSLVGDGAAAKSPILSQRLRSSSTGFIDQDGSNQNKYQKASLTTSFILRDGNTMTSDGQIEFLVLDGKTSTQGLLKFKLASDTVTVGFIVNAKKSEFFLNGESLSKEELAEDYGIDIDEMLTAANG